MPPFSKFLLVFGIATICTTILVSLGASIASDASTVSCILISCIASLCTGAALLFCVQKSYQQPLTFLQEILSQAAQKRFALINTDAVPFPALQQDLKTVLADYQYTNNFYTGILTGMPMPYLLVDTEERAISTNKTCLEMLEIDGTVEKSLGKTLADLFYNDPTRKTAVGKAMATGEVFQNLEVTIQGHKGKVQNVLANVFPIYDNNHTCVGGLCLYVNMTRLKDAEQLILTKNKQMAEAAVLLEKTAHNIVECTTKLSEVIQSSDTYASQATQKLYETANAMEEMNSSVQNVSENAHTASQSSVDTKAKALNGERIVKDSLHSIESVRANTDQLKNDMSELNKHTQNITQIMSVISDIADQTNLLALNAAIEAARAGEAGRGFAVVADEVRKLAEKTISSTSDVRSAIEAIQKSTEKSMISMDNAVEQVNNATDQSNKSGEALKEIVLTVEATADQVNSIAQASTEQSSISKVITEAMISADELVRRNAQAIAGATSTVNDLVKQSQSLTELIKNLKS